MDIETATRELHNYMMRLFKTEYKRSEGACKGEEPSVEIACVIVNDWDECKPFWHCHIYSYLVEIRDDDNISKRGYDYYANSLDALYEKVYKAINDADIRGRNIPRNKGDSLKWSNLNR